MKKMISVLLALLCAALCLPALAQEAQPQYITTLRLIEELDANATPWTFREAESGDELLTLTFAIEDKTFEQLIYLNAEGNLASLYVEKVIAFEDADYAAVLRQCNELNSSYKFTRFFINERDNTVVCAMNLILHDDLKAGEIVFEGLSRMQSIFSQAYPTLAPLSR